MAEAEGDHADSEYSSRYTNSSVQAGSLSQAEACDVLIFYHHNSNMKKPVEEAIGILQQNQLVVRTSHEATFVAGPAKQELYLSSAMSSRYRIFVMNTSFVKHDLPQCQGVLFNGDVCTIQNTLFVCRDAHKKKIPPALAHIANKALSYRAKGSEIAEHVMKFIEKNKAVAVIPADQPATRYEKDDETKTDLHMAEKKRLFLDAMDRFDRKRLYALCVYIKPVPSGSKISDALSLIHWPKVFDFDTDTNTSGLYGNVKDKLPKGRLNFLTTCDKACEIRQNIINWTAITVDEGDNGELDRHISSLAKFCSGRKPPTMLILWYAEECDDELIENLREFLGNVKFSFRGRKIKFVICLPEVPDGNPDLSTIYRRYGCHGAIAPLGNVCDWILGLTDELAANKLLTTARLPKLKEDDDDNTFELNQDEFDWVSVDLQVLSASSPLSKTMAQEDKVDQNGIEFLKGGQLTWNVMENGQFVVSRDKLRDIHGHIEHLVQNGQSCIVTLYHAPGSGGSTLGRHVLWSLRAKVPCLALETKGQIQDDFKEKIKMIRDQSHLPVLLLIDGRSSQEVRNILDICRYERLIILHVLRQYFSRHKKQDRKGIFYLHDRVSPKEAQDFNTTLVKHGAAGIRKAMQRLTKDIENGISHHSVFEFGLTAFNLDFKGIGKYVESHLCLQNKENWHKAAAMLSLAHYYGNRSLPSEFFCNILEKKGFDSVNMAYDIPELGQQLIRECSDGNEWKISHYLVAKEILEQYLGGDASDSNKAQLSLAARRRLPDLAVEFLDYMKKHEGEGYTLHDDLLSIVKDLFILRNDRDDEEEDDDERNSKRWQPFARLITDISDKEQQRKVFTMLVENFPSNADFHAHFGRFLAKLSCHREAEDALRKAIAIRLENLTESGVDVRTRGDDVLQRIHNMSGFAYNDHLREIFGNKPVGFVVGNAYEGLPLPKVQKAYAIAKEAIKEFRQSRYYYCPSANQSYAYIGEIKARFRIIEFCWRQSGYELVSISNTTNRLNFLWNFIVESFTECENLLDQCIDKYGYARTVQQELHKLLKMFMKYYSQDHYHLKRFMERMDRNSFSFKRCQITYLRLMCQCTGTKREFRVIPDLPSTQFGHYVELLESIINDKASSAIQISPYMDDWMKISRFLNPPVSLNNAKSLADDWDKRKEKESFSSFYRYIIQFLVTLCNVTPGNKAHLKQCKERLEQCQRYLKLSIVEVPIERIRKINELNKSSLALLKNHKDTREELLQFFYGTVVDARNSNGRIEIQQTGLEVFFVPEKLKVRSFHATSRQRVRFSIGFNAKRGAQAYGVTLMSTYKCGTCPYQIDCESENYNSVECPLCRCH